MSSDFQFIKLEVLTKSEVLGSDLESTNMKPNPLVVFVFLNIHYGMLGCSNRGQNFLTSDILSL